MASGQPLRIGICGLGFMGRQYFAHLRDHAHARVTAVCDQDAKRRVGDWSDSVGNINARAGQRVDLAGINAHAHWNELIADESVDAVAITLPTPTHADVTERALAAGKHVVCEKPMALTLADCDRMIAAARQSGRTLMVAQCIRFWPQYEEIKRRVDAGEIGSVRFASLKRLASPPGYSQGGWLMDGTKSGGALLDLHVHDVDFAQHLLGLPAKLTARGSRGPSGAIDHVISTYAYDDGRYALLEGGWVFHAPWPFDMAITVVGAAGTLDWSMRRGPEVLHYRGGDEPEKIVLGDETGWMRELDYFTACVRAGQPVARCLPESSRASIALALLERASVEGGGKVVAVETT
jgi:1,5-anhydro-D-fructose reductase (1,5-anhydro-D-mannitol-forming)